MQKNISHKQYNIKRQPLNYKFRTLDKHKVGYIVKIPLSAQRSPYLGQWGLAQTINKK